MKTMLSNLKQASRNNENLKIGGGSFSPLEVKEFVTELEKLIQLSTLAFRNLSDDRHEFLRDELRKILNDFNDL